MYLLLILSAVLSQKKRKTKQLHDSNTNLIVQPPPNAHSNLNTGKILGQMCASQTLMPFIALRKKNPKLEARFFGHL